MNFTQISNELEKQLKAEAAVFIIDLERTTGKKDSVPLHTIEAAMMTAAATALQLVSRHLGNDLLQNTLTRPQLLSMKRRAEMRPQDYAQLSPSKQWDIDKKLGILDWDGR